METISIPFDVLVSNDLKSFLKIIDKHDISKIENIKMLNNNKYSVTLPQLIDSFKYDNVDIKKAIFSGECITRPRKKELTKEELETIQIAFEKQHQLQKRK